MEIHSKRISSEGVEARRDGVVDITWEVERRTCNSRRYIVSADDLSPNSRIHGDDECHAQSSILLHRGNRTSE